jgi:hypothetical protein
MDIEHFGFLSSVFRKRKSHEQDGETLRAIRLQTASGDPAMAFEPSVTGTRLFESGIFRLHDAAGPCAADAALTRAWSFPKTGTHFSGPCSGRHPPRIARK